MDHLIGSVELPALLLRRALLVPPAIEPDQNPSWPLSRPPQIFETSLPGVFAVGDVRAGSVKRVAAAVGEGSTSVSLVHRALAEL